MQTARFMNATTASHHRHVQANGAPMANIVNATNDTFDEDVPKSNKPVKNVTWIMDAKTKDPG